MALQIGNTDKPFTYLSRGFIPATPFRFVVGFNDSIENQSEHTKHLPLHVTSGTFPYKAFEDTNATKGNRRVYLPSFYDVSDVTINFVESESNIVWDWYNSWTNKLFFSKKHSLFNLPSKYKKSFYVYRLSRDFSRVHALKYIGAYPKSLSDIEYDYSNNSELMIFSVTFSVDDVDFASKKLESFDVTGGRIRDEKYRTNKTKESDYGYWGSENASDYKTNETSRDDYPNWEDRWALSTGVLASILG